MSSGMNKYYTAGRFAELCGVSKQALFHYDKIGLLKPEKRKENGYRYYSFKQIEIMQMINMLKELDMPLQEIREYMDHRSPENLERLLIKESKEVDRIMEEVRWARHYIRAKLCRTQEAMEVEYGKIKIRYFAEEHFIITPFEGKDDDRHEAENIARHVNYVHSQDVYSSYAVGSIVSVEDLHQGKYKYAYNYTRIDSAEDKYNYVKPAGDYLTYYDPYGYRNLSRAAGDMLQYAEEHGLQCGQYFYEDQLLDALSGATWDEYLVKLSVRVK